MINGETNITVVPMRGDINETQKCITDTSDLQEN